MSTHTLSKSLIDQVKIRWLDLWHAKLADGADAHCQMWYQAIMETIERAGFQILSADLLAQEKSIRLDDMGAEYVQALIDITGASESDAVALFTATPEQRLKACKVVRAYQHAQQRLDEGGH